MFNRCCTARLGFLSMVAAFLWAVPSSNAFAQCGGHGGMGGHDHASAGHDSHGGHSEHQSHLPNGGLPPLVQRTPHGGLFLETGSHSLEVVYLPRETRVYLYEKSRQPLSTRKLHAFMSPRLHDDSNRSQIPLEYVVLPVGSKEQDYVAAAVDVTQLPDGTPITFRFENLPDRLHPKSEFTPIFTQSQVRPYFATVSLTQADREGLVGQQVCPITGARLGSMGTPIKVLVGDRPLYLCCAGCIEQVRETTATLSAQSVPNLSR